MHTFTAEGFIAFVAFNCTGKAIAGACSEGTVRIWDSLTGEFIATLSGHDNRVGTVAFNPENDSLLSGDETGEMKVWDWQSGECLQTLNQHDNNSTRN